MDSSAAPWVSVSAATPAPSRAFALRPTPPFDFAAALDYLRASPSAVLERVGEGDDGSYRKALRLHGRDVLLSVRQAGSVEEPQIVGALAGDRLDEAAEEAARALVTRVFALDVDPAPFLALGERDGVFGALIRRFPGLRPVLIADPFEALIWAVLGQQITVAFARTLKLRLVALAGRTLAMDGAEYPIFPDPTTLAALDPDLLRAHQFSRQKAAYVISLAAAVRDGELDFAHVRALPRDEAIAALTRFHGVGRWTAEYLLMRGLGDRDSIPAADVGLRAVIGRWYGLGRKASEAEVRAYAEAWAGWRSWAAFHWWHALQRRDAPA